MGSVQYVFVKCQKMIIGASEILGENRRYMLPLPISLEVDTNYQLLCYWIKLTVSNSR